MELVAKKMFRETEIRVYRHEGKNWLPAHDIEQALGLPREAFDASVRKLGREYGAEGVLFQRTVKQVRRVKGADVEKAELLTRWMVTYEGARLFAVKTAPAGGREFIAWVDAVQSALPNVA